MNRWILHCSSLWYLIFLSLKLSRINTSFLGIFFYSLLLLLYRIVSSSSNFSGALLEWGSSLGRENCYELVHYFAKVNIKSTFLYLLMSPLPFLVLKTGRRLVLLLCLRNFLYFQTASRTAISSPEMPFAQDAKV